MKIVSTNIGNKVSFEWNGKTVETGIFKKPVNVPIFLGKTDVEKDVVCDRENHGGIDKACYFYGANHYSFWKEKYPNLKFEFGMFGENITLDNIDETIIRIGNIYQVGNAIVQISEPRIPCFKLGHKFNDQLVIKEFINSSYSGFYVRILKEGTVTVGDEFKLIEQNNNDFSVEDAFSLLSYNKNNQLLLEMLKNEPLLGNEYRKSILKRI
ncbi:MAG: MOSC domain-containing protein [Flavobacteriales bacterium]|nr:MOSC domain-containing protein [Flavobacteriales bacterium]